MALRLAHLFPLSTPAYAFLDEQLQIIRADRNTPHPFFMVMIRLDIAAQQINALCNAFFNIG